MPAHVDLGTRAPAPVEVACDESGFTGGNLTFPNEVFVHASLRVDRSAAAEEMTRLRRRIAAHGELKASWLLRWCDQEDLDRLLGPEGLIGGQVRIHLTAARVFLLARLLDVTLGSREVSGLDLPGAEPSTYAIAQALDRSGELEFGAERWQGFLVAAGNPLRATSRWIPESAVDDLEDVVRGLVTDPTPALVGSVLRDLMAAGDRLRAQRSRIDQDPRRPPLLEPLLPAVTRAVLAWGADHPRLVVVHDEQSGLTPSRVVEMEQMLARAHPGHTLELVRVDSRDDPRVQIADLVAGIARRAAQGLLTGRPDRALLDLVAPQVDPASIWRDDTWSRSRPATSSTRSFDA